MRHSPLEQVSVLGQAKPHSPQFVCDVRRLTQTPLQLVYPVGQVVVARHSPLEQNLGARADEAALAAVRLRRQRFTQRPLQLESGAVQVPEQAPLEQKPVPQELPHEPQSVFDVRRLAQPSAHMAEPGAQPSTVVVSIETLESWRKPTGWTGSPPTSVPCVFASVFCSRCWRATAIRDLRSLGPRDREHDRRRNGKEAGRVGRRTRGRPLRSGDADRDRVTPRRPADRQPRGVVNVGCRERRDRRRGLQERRRLERLLERLEARAGGAEAVTWISCPQTSGFPEAEAGVGILRRNEGHAGDEMPEADGMMSPALNVWIG